jgi:solute carrier family 25 protein 38
VIKTIQQGARLAIEAAVPGVPPTRGAPEGVWSTARTLVAAEGPDALWKGLNATVVRVFFGAGVYFASLHALLDACQGEGGSPPPPTAAFAAGVTARGLATALMSPVAVVKTRMEWAGRGSTPYARGTLRALGHIRRTEGLHSLYAGLVPTLLRDAPFSGIYVAAYTHLKAVLSASVLLPSGKPEDGAGSAGRAAAVHLAAGLLAGAFATLLTHPADVLKTRLQMRDAKGVFVDGRVLYAEAVTLVRSEGLGALFTGAPARVMKRGAQTALTWTLFEEAMRRSGGGSGG